MRKTSKPYRCYSVPQKEFILSKGIEYLDVFKNEEGKTLWLFLKCDELDKALTEWSNNNPNKHN